MMKRPFLYMAIVWLQLTASQLAVGQSQSTASAPLQAVDAEAFEAMLRFYDYNSSLPLQAQIVERKATELSVFEKFVFRGVCGRMVPGYLEFPRNHPAPAPLVLLLHGWSGGKDRWWKDGNYYSGGELRTALLNAGFAVMAIDAPAHGDRIAENDYALVNDLSDESRPNHQNYFTVNDIVVQGTRDCRRALDYANTRTELDPQRIGMLGYSMGGWQTFILTAVDPRIQVAVACVTPSLAGQATPIAPKDYARGIGDRPFLMLMGREDSMCSPTHAQQLLELIPGERKQLIWFEAGHKLPADYVPQALNWFTTYLK